MHFDGIICHFDYIKPTLLPIIIINGSYRRNTNLHILTTLRVSFFCRRYTVIFMFPGVGYGEGAPVRRIYYFSLRLCSIIWTYFINHALVVTCTFLLLNTLSIIHYKSFFAVTIFDTVLFRAIVLFIPNICTRLHTSTFEFHRISTNCTIQKIKENYCSVKRGQM